MSRFQTRDLFCSLLPRRCFVWFLPCWATVFQTESHFERHSVHLLLSKPNWSIVTRNERKFQVCLFVWQSLSNMWFIDPHGGQIVFEVIFKQTVIIAVTLATVDRIQDICVLWCCFFCPIFRLYLDILDLILFCLYMLPVGSIKTTTATKTSIYPSPSDHTQLYSSLKLGDPCCLKSLFLYSWGC